MNAATGKQAINHIRQQGDAPLWLMALAKSGYIARGVIYVIIGSLALLQAFGQGGESTDSQGAVEKILQAPGGSALLWAIVIGLIGYAAWRFCQALLDADDHGRDAKGLAVRSGLLASAVTHSLLAVYAGSLAVQLGTSSSDSGSSGSEGLVARMLSWPGGQWLVGLVGLCIIGAGVAHAAKAAKEKYKRHLDLDESAMQRLDPVCKIGLYSRVVAFLVIGGMFVFAAVDQDPDEAGGLQEVLNKLAEQPFGMILLGAMALGLIAFGIYSSLEGLFRKINCPEALSS